MKLLLQWSTSKPEDFWEVDARDIESFARKAIPIGGEAIDDAPGWMHSWSAQGIGGSGFDHYKFDHLADSAMRVTQWRDDPEDWDASEFLAEVWELALLAPDLRHGNAYNTNQKLTVYAVPGSSRWLFYSTHTVENTTLRPWSEFVPPSDPFHGIWTPDELDLGHEETKKPKGWREWTEGVEFGCVEDGKLCQQAKLGRFHPHDGTITKFLSDTTDPLSYHAGDHELAAVTETSTVGTITVGAVPTVNQNREIIWTFTPLNDGADFPNGVYEFQLDCTTNAGSWTYGALTVNGLAGHMAVVDTVGASDRETWTQTQGVFSGTGLKLGSRSINPATGAALDTFEVRIAANHPSSHGGGSDDLIFDVNEADQYMKGPFTAETVGEAIGGRIHGQVLALGDERGGRIEGEAGSTNITSEIGGRIQGVVNVTAEIGGRIQGVVADNSEIGGRVHGIANIQSEIGGRIQGVAADNSEIGGRISGTDSSQSEIGGRTHGIANVTSEIGGRVQGVVADNSEVGGRIEGILGASGEIGGRTHGTANTTAEIGGRIQGVLADSSEIGGRIEGDAGATNVTSEIGGRVQGVQADASEIGGRINGEAQATGEIGGRVQGVASTQAEIGGRVQGVASVSSEIGGRAHGTAQATSEIGGRVQGFLADNSEVGGRIEGTDSDSSVIGGRISGVAPVAKTISVGLRRSATSSFSMRRTKKAESSQSRSTNASLTMDR